MPEQQVWNEKSMYDKTDKENTVKAGITAENDKTNVININHVYSNEGYIDDDVNKRRGLATGWMEIEDRKKEQERSVMKQWREIESKYAAEELNAYKQQIEKPKKSKTRNFLKRKMSKKAKKKADEEKEYENVIERRDSSIEHTSVDFEIELDKDLESSNNGTNSICTSSQSDLEEPSEDVGKVEISENDSRTQQPIVEPEENAISIKKTKSIWEQRVQEELRQKIASKKQLKVDSKEYSGSEVPEKTSASEKEIINESKEDKEKRWAEAEKRYWEGRQVAQSQKYQERRKEVEERRRAIENDFTDSEGDDSVQQRTNLYTNESVIRPHYAGEIQRNLNSDSHSYDGGYLESDIYNEIGVDVIHESKTSEAFSIKAKNAEKDNGEKHRCCILL